MVEAPRAPHREMTDARNRNVLGTFNNKLLGCAQRCIANAREFEIPAMEERTLDFLMTTTGLDGRGREDLRDALMGARPQVPALAQGQSNHDGVPRL